MVESKSGLMHLLNMIWPMNLRDLLEAKLYRISLLNIELMMRMNWGPAILLAHHGSYSLMDRLVIMVKRLVLFLSLRVALFLNSQTDRRKNVRITKLNMKRFYLAWKFLESMGVKHGEA